MAVFCVVQLEIPGQNENQRICFTGLSETKLYRIKLLAPLDGSIKKMLKNPETWMRGFNLSGSVLMESGISLFMPWPQTGVLVECIEIGRRCCFSQAPSSPGPDKKPQPQQDSCGNAAQAQYGNTEKLWRHLETQ